MKKIKFKKSFKITIILLVLLIGGILLYILLTGSKNLYSKDAEKVIKEEKYENIYDYDYSKIVETLLQKGIYNEKYLEEYLDIEEIEDEKFIENINDLLDKGYKGKEINYINKLSDKNKDLIFKNSYMDIKDFYKLKNFNVANYERYVNYLKDNQDTKIENVVTKVNIGLDKEFYTAAEKIENPDDLTVIVNKYHYLDKDYVPKNLVTLFDSTRGAKMVDVAAEAYKNFIEAAKKDNITLESTTAYRSYSFQNTLYTNYVAQDGKEKADTYSARPGFSEHQTGLAVDLNDPTVSGKRLDDKDYQWVLNNSYKYGFILRYQERFVPITGYMEEPWHIRYLGVELATKVHDSNLSYEEYYDLYIAKY